MSVHYLAPDGQEMTHQRAGCALLARASLAHQVRTLERLLAGLPAVRSKLAGAIGRRVTNSFG